MLDRTEAETLLLKLLNSSSKVLERGDRFAISSVELSSNKDYWVIRANSEAYVIEGDFNRFYIGVNAYLIDICTGEIEIVGSSQSIDEYLQDKYDAKAAKGLMYVLGSGYKETDKKTIIKLRQLLQCSLSESRELIMGEKRFWFTGKKRILCAVVRSFNIQNIETDITLVRSCNLPELSSFIFWEDVVQVMHKRIAA
jgi:hypothetical protein